MRHRTSTPPTGIRPGGGVLGVPGIAAAIVPPNLGWHDFYWAEDLALGEINANFAARYGTGDLIPSATGPSVATGGADYNGRKYVTHTATDQHLCKAMASIAQPFVIVAYAQVTDTQGTGTWCLFDSYTDGTLPTDRVAAQFIDAALDQQRINAGLSTHQSNWGSDTNDKLWEITVASPSSTWAKDGSVILTAGDSGPNAMAGLTIAARYDLAAAQHADNLSWAYVGRISQTAWLAGRARFLTWHNRFYAKAIA